MTTFNFTMTDDQIVAGIKSIGSRAKSIRVDVHKTICAITNNWARAGAVNVAAQRMTELLAAIDGAHKQKLVNWCNAFCSFSMEKDDNGKEFFRYDPAKTTMTVEEWAACKANNLYDFTPDTPPVAFNFQQKLKALIEQAEKRMKADPAKRNEDDAISQAEIDAAKALLVAAE